MRSALDGQAYGLPSVRHLPARMTIPPVDERENERAEYRRALKWLFSFANYEVVPAVAYEAAKFNLERMRALLAALGNPHDKFESVHIAGTKGKGSTAAICESILRAAGYKTGLYTSPHLHTFRERIQVSGGLVEPRAVVAGVARLREIQPQFPEVSVFELMTALAFDFFARSGVQVAVVEVGIGGRLDATNVIAPRVAVLTSISYDHMTVLGDTLTKIAREKAGIIKPGIPVVIAPQGDEALAVFEAVARERGAPVTLVGRDWKWQLITQDLDHQDFHVTGPSPDSTPRQGKGEDQANQVGRVLSYDLRLHLLGAHQLANATTAIAASQVLGQDGAPIDAQAVRAGVASARWPGRFEILERAPYLIADGAHNRDSAKQLVGTLDTLLPGSRLIWIFGSSSDKDIEGMFDELLPRSSELIITRSKHPRAADPSELARLALGRSAESVIADSVPEALDLAHRRAGRNDVIVVTGSLFVVAEARALIARAHGEQVESDE